MLKRLANRAKDLLYIKPLVPLWRRRLQGKAMVYLYHRIQELDDCAFLDKGGSPYTSAKELTRDIRSLKQLGAKFVRFSELTNCDYNVDEFYVVVCVDDGFASNYRAGLDVAKTEDIPITIFQCASMVAATDLLWEHQLYYLYYHDRVGLDFKIKLQENGWPNSCDDIRESVSPLKIEEVINDFVSSNLQIKQEMNKLVKDLYPSKEHLIEAQNLGHEIASHGDKHYKRTSISDDVFIAELVNSKRKLNDVLDQPIKSFSYPFNSYIAGDDLKCAKEYSFIATVDGGVVDQATKFLSIPRNTFPGRAKNKLRHRRWLLTGSI